MSWEVQTAAWKKMNTDQVLIDLVDGRIFKDAPQDAGYPMIELGPDEDFNESADCITLYGTTLIVVVWSLIEEGDGVRGKHQAQKICRAVRECLNDIDLDIEGCAESALSWRRTSVVADQDGKAWFGTVEFTGSIEELETN